MDNLEQICFEMIVIGGQAKSEYLKAIDLAKKKEYEKAQEALLEADRLYQNGEKKHLELIADSSIQPSILLLHAEDILSNSEVVGILARQLIDFYKDTEK